MSGTTEEKALEYLERIKHLELERRENGSILASVNAAIGRAGIHCAVTFAEAIDMIAARSSFNTREREDLRVAVNSRIEDLKHATSRHGANALKYMRITGQEALEEMDRLYELRRKL